MNEDTNLKQIAFDLFLWTRRKGDNFTSMLFDLIMKSDPQNMAKLERGFPAHVNMIREWQASPTEKAFFIRMKVPGVS